MEECEERGGMRDWELDCMKEGMREEEEWREEEPWEYEEGYEEREYIEE